MVLVADCCVARRGVGPLMPELPEVETVARCLRRHVVGESIVKTCVLLERAIAHPDARTFAMELTGRSFVGFGRRAKYLLAELAPRGWLVVHLRMSGRVCIVQAQQPPDKHTRLVLELSSGRAIRMDDQRTFGRVWLVDDPAPLLEGLGPEPLSEDWTAESLAAALRGRRRMLKPLLLSQAFLAGLGNIYVDEALHMAGLHPALSSDRLTPSDVARLHKAIRDVLTKAIEHGGTTLRDFCTPEGNSGEYQLARRVYGREGEACGRCGGPIVKMRLAQRGTHYCPVCQPAPAELRGYQRQEAIDGQ